MTMLDWLMDLGGKREMTFQEIAHTAGVSTDAMLRAIQDSAIGLIPEYKVIAMIEGRLHAVAPDALIMGR